MTKKTAANLLLIKKSPFFSSLPPELLVDMAGNFLLHSHNKRDFFDPTLLLERFYFILTGKIELTRRNIETGKEVTLSVLHERDSFDVICLLDKKPRNLEIKPMTDLQLISLPIDMMRDWVWTYPGLNRLLMPYLASKMREQEELIADLALHDVVTRLSRLILRNIDKLKCLEGTDDKGGKHLAINVSDEALARMVGSVRQVVNKHLQYWKKAGLVERKKNKLLIKDMELLGDEAKNTALLINKC